MSDESVINDEQIYHQKKKMHHQQRRKQKLKSDSHLPKKLYYCFIEIPLKMMKNAFYFILKALFVLKIFKFLSWLFGHVRKTAY